MLVSLTLFEVAMKEHVSIVIVTLILVLARLVGMFLMAIGFCEQYAALAYQLTREKRQEPKRMAGFSFSRIEKKPYLFLQCSVF